jgi:hypothetical protein
MDRVSRRMTPGITYEEERDNSCKLSDFMLLSRAKWILTELAWNGTSKAARIVRNQNGKGVGVRHIITFLSRLLY